MVEFFKWSKLYQTSPTTISWHSTHFAPNNRTKTSWRYLTILHFINRQKVYFQHNFKSFADSTKRANLISNSVFEPSEIPWNNIYSPNQRLHFHLLNLHFKFHLSTNYKLYFIFVYKKIFFHAKRLNLPVYFLVGIFISTLM